MTEQFLHNHLILLHNTLLILDGNIEISSDLCERLFEVLDFVRELIDGELVGQGLLEALFGDCLELFYLAVGSCQVAGEVLY